MSRIETAKLTSYAAIGSLADSVVVPKIIAFAVLVPGTDGTEEPPDRQGFCYGQRVRRS